MRQGIAWSRRRTWHWQDAAHTHRSPTIRGARRTHSVGYLRWVEQRWNRRRVAAYKLAHRSRVASVAATGGTVPTLICRVFGSAACSKAIDVARCESGFSIHAVNGQYLGIFQMGSSERATYATIGYATAYEQIVAAHNYYVVSGWGPWACA